MRYQGRPSSRVLRRRSMRRCLSRAVRRWALEQLRGGRVWAKRAGQRWEAVVVQALFHGSVGVVVRYRAWVAQRCYRRQASRLRRRRPHQEDRRELLVGRLSSTLGRESSLVSGSAWKMSLRMKRVGYVRVGCRRWIPRSLWRATWR